ncbi:TPA: hypothetical protein ACF9H0_002443 [Staphylococcus aureus]|uniref:hypothetical protein n=1 Tax=Staphylococcus aureus TaxID=1280 RepID=UPI0004487829|nr:hypothetical protein [Staphylococcus aureus]MBE5677218.1 hypothetical protein [Staphylococcus singaporensis]EWJ88106.1 hypothetical protein U607_02707 [Staphylococcus aureus F36687]EWT80272.1 hypothetical protein V330_02758 [Staphylococcus aureus F85609]EWV01710.1 hypothetical protein U621_02842 [Staphylococcus aureus F53393]HBI1187668.1 hypothetical protein [Staphylococcus aureus]
MAKKSLMDNLETSNLNNSFINQKQKTENLPETSLRIKGDTHSKINAIKKVEMKESLNTVLDMALEKYISSLNKEKREEIRELTESENEYKLRKARKQAQQKN